MAIIANAMDKLIQCCDTLGNGFLIQSISLENVTVDISNGSKI